MGLNSQRQSTEATVELQLWVVAQPAAARLYGAGISSPSRPDPCEWGSVPIWRLSGKVDAHDAPHGAICKRADDWV